MDLPKNQRILVVDDNDAIHDDFRKILSGGSAEASALDDIESSLFDDVAAPSPLDTFELTSAYQGEEALKKVREAAELGTPYAMAFVDMRMPPGWDGVRTIEELWKVDADLQVVICTAFSDHSWKAVLDRLGVNDRLLLLKKPFDAAEVSQLACALTEKWHLARAARLTLTELRTMVDKQTENIAQSNQLLKESETRFALAAAGANDGLWDWSFDDDTVYYSPRWKEMLGFADAEVGNTPEDWWAHVHPEDRDRVERELGAHRRGETAQISVEYRIRTKNGQYRWMLCRGMALRNEAGRAYRAAGSQTDVTDRKAGEAQLRYAAHHDPLTGLPNRAFLADRIEQWLARTHSEPDFRFAVLCIDLDRFKVINDSLGHLVGDGLLVALAKRLSSVIRGSDTLAIGGRCDLLRIGGDEFVILLENVHREEDAVGVANRLLNCLTTPITVEGHDIYTSLSIGIAMGQSGYGRVEEVLRDADTALYRAKADGRGRARVFCAELHTRAMARWQTECDLRFAVERNELCLHYQPVVDLMTGEVLHFEALVRWQHPTRGLLMPGEFISLAEETGQIIGLGQWVLEEACRQVGEWRARLPHRPDISVAVNVASNQFLRPAFVDDVVAVLRDTGTPASALKLEITESATMGAGAIETCVRLGELGLQLHLDDFGTGYSSLSYLHRMPIHVLKIDRSFVSTACDNEMNASIVKTVLGLSKALGMETIAEGVETEAQLELLRELGCPAAQGYYWAKPLVPERAFEMLAAGAENLTKIAS